MRKYFLLIVACCMTALALAQESPIIVEGDLNKDGFKDKVVADLGSEEDIAVYFGDGKGGHTLFCSYATTLSEYDHPSITITDKGVLRIQNGSSGNCDIFLFRFQDGDFYLIGSKTDRHENDHYDVSHNYLTGKMIRTDGEGSKKKSQTIEMPEMPLLRLGWFPLDMEGLDFLFENYEVENPKDYKTAMGLYRLMQWNGILYPSFYLYHDLGESPTNSWSAYNEIMAFGRLNYWSSLEINRQDDDTWLIHLTDEYEDRTYEQYLDEEMENLEEAIAKADEERGGEPAYSATEFLYSFKNGKFTLLSQVDKEQETKE